MLCRSRCVLAGAAFAVLSACSASLEVQDAGAGRLQGLDQRVAAEVEQGRLARHEALDIARAVARGEIERATGDPGKRLIRRMKDCIAPLSGALSRRADTRDDVGAFAAMTLIEAKLSRPGSFDATLDAPVGAWRAIAVRGLVGDGPREQIQRRRFIVDGDEDVRMAALRAAADARDPRDTDLVLEAARLDPSPEARVAAVRAAGAIGGERVVLALKDLWPLADEPMRRAIADAWSRPDSIDAGGRRELLFTIDHEHGSAAIAAAFALLVAGGEGEQEALGCLERAIASGPPKDRIFAMLLAPTSAETIRAALVKASDDGEEAVAVAAMSRRLNAREAKAAERPAIIAKLVKLAAGTTRGMAPARAALAKAGERGILQSLTHASRSADAREREAAGVDLAELGELARAAVVVVDADADARTRVACAMLAR